MLSTTSNQPWLFRHSFNPLIDFCVWVLERDGLHIAPFDVHPKGDGKLQSAGLQEQEWKSWLARVAFLQNKQFQATSQALKSQQSSLSLLQSEEYNPLSSWSGNSLIGQLLGDLWQQYQPISNKRRTWEKPLAHQWRSIMQQVWNDLQSYRALLPSLTVYLIEYPKQIDYLLPSSSSVVMTIVDGSLEGQAFQHRVLNTAEALLKAQNS